MTQIVAVTVTYGKRGKYLKQTVDAVASDSRVSHIVIVDNASSDQEMLEELKRTYAPKVVVLHEEKNTGSAGGFARGLGYARTLQADYVLLLDDDNVLEEDGISFFLENLETLGKRNAIVLGNRVNIVRDNPFIEGKTKDFRLEKTFFDMFSFKKILRHLKSLSGLKKEESEGVFAPIVPSKGFVYGGAFLPMEVLHTAPLPDKELVLYGDDVAYSWSVYDAGYVAYLCHRPIVRDVDMTFEEGNHILGLFDPKAPTFKVYYRIRNMVRISRQYSEQSKPMLFLSVVAWLIGLFAIALAKGMTEAYMERVRLIVRAAYDGYHNDAPVPAQAKLP